MIPRVPVTTGDMPTWVRTAANAINTLIRLFEAPPAGPYADDAAAETAGVPIGYSYRKPDGTMAWRVS